MTKKLVVTVVATLCTYWPSATKAADPPATASLGILNSVAGQVLLGTQWLNANADGETRIGAGQSLQTYAGRVEILLSPGVFVRLGDMSLARILSATATDAALAVDRGEATVEVVNLGSQSRLGMLQDNEAAELLTAGLYDFDADQHEIRVVKGEAVVEVGGRAVHLKSGYELKLAGASAGKPKKFDNKANEQKDLYRWTMQRSSYLAAANIDSARSYAAIDSAWSGARWYWSPSFNAFTYIPDKGIVHGPFGWAFYSPGRALEAPQFYSRIYARPPAQVCVPPTSVLPTGTGTSMGGLSKYESAPQPEVPARYAGVGRIMGIMGQAFSGSIGVSAGFPGSGMHP